MMTLCSARKPGQHSQYDLLIIGGGATGCGIAVDAASRGLKVALVEKNDLAEGTSSKSTKLVHGGVRYLEAAVKNLDRAQYNLVKEALHERGLFLKNAPHLAHPLPLITPIYNWFEVPYVYAGLVMYDLLAGRLGLGHSKLISRAEALRRFPMLKADGLKAGVVYYDGQFNDARMAVSLARTAERHGATVLSHAEVVSLEKTDGKLSGARVHDTLTGEEFIIQARGIINAAGPFVDRIRQMDDAQAAPILKAASGIHIVLDGRFAPPDTGLLIPKTEDGRVLFILPWQGHALVGTTDSPAEIMDHPQAKEEEIAYVLRHINKYFDMGVTRQDVSSVWCGLRPLIQADPSANTAQLVREHLLMESNAGLISMAGGKWTSYRKMAEEAVDQAVKSFNLTHAGPCRTENLPIVGAEHFAPAARDELASEMGLPGDVAEHLHKTFGDEAGKVAALAHTGFEARLHAAHPYIEAEVVFAARHEYAQRAIDVIARRLPLALVDLVAAKTVLPRVIDIMAKELGWDSTRCAEENNRAQQRLETAL